MDSTRGWYPWNDSTCDCFPVKGWAMGWAMGWGTDGGGGLGRLSLEELWERSPRQLLLPRVSVRMHQRRWVVIDLVRMRAVESETKPEDHRLQSQQKKGDEELNTLHSTREAPSLLGGTDTDFPAHRRKTLAAQQGPQ